MDDRSRGGRVGALLLVFCAPLATWWLVGDLSEWGGDYYMLKPLKLSFGDEAVFGVVAVVGAAIGLLLVARSRPRLVGPLTWWEWAVVLVGAAAVVTASMYRVFISGTVGANIGGGMMFFTAVPLVCALLFAAAESLRRQERVSLTDRTVLSSAIALGVGHFLAGMFSLWVSLGLIAVLAMVPIVGIGRGSLRHTFELPGWFFAGRRRGL